MGKVLFFAATFFTAIELLASWKLYFDKDDADSLTPGAFLPYVQMDSESPPCDLDTARSVALVIEFFGLWVGNSKTIMSMLLIICATSSCARTNLLTAFSMVVGCAIYFPRMHPLLVEIEARGDMREGYSAVIFNIIGKTFLPMWLMVFLWELRSYQTNKNEKL
mmetsp:Transcript_47407/g.92493  ORF Transcript_47407/g.92493 Transcript_47407/m.92493 type:complete len:164 (-) Transcript_47407:232-723(-)